MKYAVDVVKYMLFGYGLGIPETFADFFYNPVGYAVATYILSCIVVKIEKGALDILSLFIPIWS